MGPSSHKRGRPYCVGGVLQGRAAELQRLLFEVGEFFFEHAFEAMLHQVDLRDVDPEVF